MTNIFSNGSHFGYFNYVSLLPTWSNVEPSYLILPTQKELCNCGQYSLSCFLFTFCTFRIHMHCGLWDTYYIKFFLLVVFMCQIYLSKMPNELRCPWTYFYYLMSIEVVWVKRILKITMSVTLKRNSCTNQKLIKSYGQLAAYFASRILLADLFSHCLLLIVDSIIRCSIIFWLNWYNCLRAEVIMNCQVCVIVIVIVVVVTCWQSFEVHSSHKRFVFYTCMNISPWYRHAKY